MSSASSCAKMRRTRTRFRSFVLSALEADGTPTQAYRRLSAARARRSALPVPGAGAGAPDEASGRPTDLLEEQGDVGPGGTPVLRLVDDMTLQHYASLIAAQERAWDRGDSNTAQAIGAALAALRKEMSDRQGVAGPT